MTCKSEVRGTFSTCCNCATGGRKGGCLLQEMYVEPCTLLPALGCKWGRVMEEWNTKVEKIRTVSMKARFGRVGFDFGGKNWK